MEKAEFLMTVTKRYICHTNVHVVLLQYWAESCDCFQRILNSSIFCRWPLFLWCCLAHTIHNVLDNRSVFQERIIFISIWLFDIVTNYGLLSDFILIPYLVMKLGNEHSPSCSNNTSVYITLHCYTCVLRVRLANRWRLLLRTTGPVPIHFFSNVATSLS